MRLSFQNFQLTSSAFNPDKRPYSEFSWVVYSTKARSGEDATRAIAERSAPVLATAVNTVHAVNHTGWQNNRPPPNGPLVPRDNPLPHPAHDSRPAPTAPAVPQSYANRTPFQALQTPASCPPVTNGLSTRQCKALLRSGEASPGSAPPPPPPLSEARKAVVARLLGMTPPASVSKAQYTPGTVNPSQRSTMHAIATPNTVGQDRTSAQNQPNRTRFFQAPIHQWPTPESDPFTVPTAMPIRSSVPRYSQTLLQSATYSPTPGPSTHTVRLLARPILIAKFPYRDVTKAPGSNESKKQMTSSELGTPSLYSHGKHLPPAGVETPAPTLSARAAGKQPVRSTVSSSPSLPPAQTEIEKPVCATCHKRHFGECRGFCSTCGFGHPGTCRDRCITCGKLHRGICWELSKIRARDLALLETASKQAIAPVPEEQNDASTSSVPDITSTLNQSRRLSLRNIHASIVIEARNV
jgi:hypothetical protein